MVKKIEDLTSKDVELLKAHGGECVANVDVFVTGKNGKHGFFKCLVKVKFFKNGKIKKTNFEIIKVIETIKIPYGFGKISYTLKEIWGF